MKFQALVCALIVFVGSCDPVPSHSNREIKVDSCQIRFRVDLDDLIFNQPVDEDFISSCTASIHNTNGDLILEMHPIKLKSYAGYYLTETITMPEGAYRLVVFAIHANNGKILAMSNGKVESRAYCRSN